MFIIHCRHVINPADATTYQNLIPKSPRCMIWIKQNSTWNNWITCGYPVLLMCVHVHGCSCSFFFAKLSVCNQAASEIVQKAKKKIHKNWKIFCASREGFSSKLKCYQLMLHFVEFLQTFRTIPSLDLKFVTIVSLKILILVRE